ncbi:MAG: UDP-3-O-(3-hydroxymyristoyl)glucosamine N-acyltransferase [Nitrospinae bacterium]|nr:UDP-3-O-(3-hydroxymyristoyl)glucosamine N-acyltransferase [Nitrospinota bacterium]
MRLKNIAALVGGVLTGDPEKEVNRCSSLASAGSDSIVFIENKKFIEQLGARRPACVIVPAGIRLEGVNTIEVKNTHIAFAIVLDALHPEKRPPAGIHPSASVHPDAKLGNGCHIGPCVCIGAGVRLGDNVIVHQSASIGENTQIGDGGIIHPNVTIYPNAVVGKRAIIHAGAVIGADGFKYLVGEKGRRIKVRHIGRVRIGDDVEIGANSCIDRAMLDETVIGDGVKIDNLVQIGHNCVIGEQTVIAAGCGVAGSVTIGKNVTIGGLAGIADHVTIADNTFIAGKTGVTGDIGPGIFGGAYAMPINEWRRAEVAYRRGAETLRRLSALEKKGE